MAIYPTKTSKLNYRKNRLRLGVTLICIFSILLTLVAFNFLEIFTIIALGSIGLLFYPICLFFITLGIFLCCNKTIKISKIMIILISLWIIFFVLILQLATSKGIDTNFATYMSTTFKSNITAGGVIFGVLLYPFYALTYDVATYIILIICLIVISAFLIDRIRIEIVNREGVTKITDTNFNDENTIQDLDDEDEMSYNSNNLVSKSEDVSGEDIFISDEEDDITIQKEEAKRTLGLGERSISDLNDIAAKSQEQNKEMRSIDSLSSVKTNTNKPNIIVHEDVLETISPLTNQYRVVNQSVVSEKDKKEEERKKAALDYLNITKGNFNSKQLPKGLDNVENDKHVNKPLEQVQQQSQQPQINLDQQTLENQDRLSRLNNLTNTLNSLNFNNHRKDLYDENLTKQSFNENRQQVISNSPNPFVPQKASEIYSGAVNESVVDPVGIRPHQVSMIEPVSRPKPTQKIYKKPPVYQRPPTDLLKAHSTNIDNDTEYMTQKGEMIVETLKSFKLDCHVINAVKGPTFTRYELQMAPGIPVNAVNGKINDLAMVLESSCRIQIPILGKNAFGIEVPNKSRVTVGLREIIESNNFQSSKSPLTFALGKNISGECKVASIDSLVHTLVAGSTGSGKSVCLNTMLLSLLYKASPDELKLLLVDPKMVEFTPFNNLPHMLIPNTIVDCDKAVMALEWLVEEMERRYAKLGAIQVRNIDEYNDSPEVLSGSIPKMFYIVMIFDEVGDFMTIAKKEIEDKVKRLAAKSRACGIHLVLATQRPTVDVITGTIKANLPSRIAFAVNSYQDSKTILESAGAESLLGMGDMLFLPKGSNDLNRIQGCFVSGKELKEVVNYIKEHNECEFDEEIEQQMFNKKDGFDPTNGAEEAFDPLLKDCLKFFIKAKRVSSSSLQANFGIGYPKANKIVMQMEKAGFISPAEGPSAKRSLYITDREFAERFGEEIDE